MLHTLFFTKIISIFSSLLQNTITKAYSIAFFYMNITISVITHGSCSLITLQAAIRIWLKILIKMCIQYY